MIPYVKWYPSDWLASRAFRVLTFEQQGVYFALLNIAWQNSYRNEAPPYLPDDPAELALELAMDQSAFGTCWEAVHRFFERKDGKLFNPRQMEEWEKAKDLIELRRKAGKAGGKGRPKRNQKTARAKQVLAHANKSQAHVSYPYPDSSDSSSLHSDTEEKPKPDGEGKSGVDDSKAPPPPILGSNPQSAESRLDGLTDQIMTVMSGMNCRAPDCHTAEKLAAHFTGACGDAAPGAVARLPGLLKDKKDPLAYLCKVAGDGGLKSLLDRKPKQTRAEIIAGVAKRMKM